MHRLHSLSFVEQLERRRLFAGFALSHHRLAINGYPTLPNTITIALNPDQQSISAQIIIDAPKGPIVLQKNFPLSDDIRAINIRGGNRDDYIHVDQTYGSFPIPCGMLGGSGYDTIIGGDEPDLMYGVSGNDYLDGGAGNDTLLGQTGDDTLIGGDGNDFLAGSFGNDDMVGGDGNDTLADGRGADTVLGGSGDNLFSIRSFKLDHVNDFDLHTDKIRYVTNNADNSTSSSPSFPGSVFPIFNL